MQIFRVLTFFSSLLISLPLIAQPVDYFPLKDVRLLESPFKHAQDKNVEYILAMEPDKLLAPFLREADLKPKAQSYGNWESTGLDGHIGGHYLSALSLAYAATGEPELKKRLNYMLDELQRAQKANGNGYIGGVPGGKKLWQEIAKGDIRADLFSLNGYWVPWYNVHKTFAGLRDAYEYTGSKQAKKMLLKLAEWAANLDLTDEQIQTMLITEHGGMNDAFAEVYKITGDKKWLTLAKHYSQKSVLQPLKQSRDELTGLHANTQIPKVIGFEKVSALSGDRQWHEAAKYFWREVVNKRSVAIGGNSVREHFHSTDDFTPMIEDVEGPETCNTYNMLKLTQLLFARDPSPEYTAYYERALYNHILASQNPETGGLVYFTPMRPQHYRVYSQTDTSMWCCVGSGIENHVKYGEFIYAHTDDTLLVNLFIPSQVTWHEKGVVVTQDNQFPAQAGTRISVEGNATFTLKLRYPHWATGKVPAVTLNDKPVKLKAEPGEYLEIKREWRSGDTVRLALPMDVRAEQMPDQSDYYALLYGPVVLAAQTDPFPEEELNFFADDSRMGHIPSAPMCPLPEAPTFVSEKPDFYKAVEKKSGDTLAFTLPAKVLANQRENLTLVPFYQLHEARYMLYWPYSTREKLASTRAKAQAEEAARLQLEAQTVDKVAPGEQQPEADHFFAGEQTEAGVNHGRHWRHAAGWFSYQMKDPGAKADTLRITYFGADVGRRFDITLAGVKVAEVHLTGEKGPNFYTVDYPIPAKVFTEANNGVMELKFIARQGSVAGGIYGVRLLDLKPE